MFSMKAIMKIKSKCVDISSEGKGIVKANNMVILVDGLLLGEEADIEVMYQRAGVYYGRITKLYNLSKERIKPNCPVSTACGGCTFQNSTYKYELAYKKKKVILFFVPYFIFGIFSSIVYFSPHHIGILQLFLIDKFLVFRSLYLLYKCLYSNS